MYLQYVVGVSAFFATLVFSISATELSSALDDNDPLESSTSISASDTPTSSGTSTSTTTITSTITSGSVITVTSNSAASSSPERPYWIPEADSSSSTSLSCTHGKQTHTFITKTKTKHPPFPTACFTNRNPLLPIATVGPIVQIACAVPLLRRFARNCDPVEFGPGWGYHHTILLPCATNTFTGTGSGPATTSADFKTMANPVSELAAGYTILASAVKGGESPVATESGLGEDGDDNGSSACGSGRGGVKPCPPSAS